MNPIAALFSAERAVARGLAAVDRTINKAGINPAQWLLNARWKARSAAATNPALSLVVARAGKTQDLDAKEALALARASELVQDLRTRLDNIGVQKLEPEEKEILSYWLTEGKRLNNDPDLQVVQAMDPQDALRMAHPASLINPADPRMQKLSDLADSINDEIQDVRYELRNLGQLSDETFNKFIDGYLQRDYEFAKSVPGSGTTRFSTGGTPPLRAVTGTYKRGEQLTTDQATFNQLQQRSQNMWHVGTSTDPSGKRTYEFYDRATGQVHQLDEPEAFEVLAKRYEVSSNQATGEVTYQQDASVWERLTKGQTYQNLEKQLGQFLNSTTRDVAKGNFLKSLANDPTYSTDSIVSNGKVLTKGNKNTPIVDDAGVTWHYIPANKTSALTTRGSGGAPYGALAGKFITDDLKQALDVEDYVAGVNEFINKAASVVLAKQSKVFATLFNPTYYGTNFLANTSAYFAYGGRHTGMLPGTLEPGVVERAKALGVIDNKATFEDLASSLDWFNTGRLTKTYNQSVEKLSRLAQAGDDYFRVRLFRDLTDQGYTEDEALLIVRKAFYDPRLQDSALLSGLEATVQPFTKVVNYLAWLPIEALAERPVNALLAFTALGMAYQHAEKLAYPDEKTAETDNALRRSYSRNLEADDGVPMLQALTQRSLRLGDYDVDLTSISPWARLAPVELMEPGAKQRPTGSRVLDYVTNQLLRAGTPVVNAAFASRGIDPVTGATIYDAARDDRWKAFFESTAPPVRHVTRALDYAQGKPNLRDVKDGPGAVFSPLVGVKLRTRDADKERLNAVMEWNAEVQAFRKRAQTLYRESAELNLAGEAEAATIRAREADAVLEAMNDYVQSSQGFLDKVMR